MAATGLLPFSAGYFIGNERWRTLFHHREAIKPFVATTRVGFWALCRTGLEDEAALEFHWLTRDRDSCFVQLQHRETLETTAAPVEEK
jgi:hypothetical protein